MSGAWPLENPINVPSFGLVAFKSFNSATHTLYFLCTIGPTVLVIFENLIINNTVFVTTLFQDCMPVAMAILARHTFFLLFFFSETLANLWQVPTAYCRKGISVHVSLLFFLPQVAFPSSFIQLLVPVLEYSNNAQVRLKCNIVCKEDPNKKK